MKPEKELEVPDSLADDVVMIKGVTDSQDDARELARLLQGMRAKVDLIPLNPAPEIAYNRPKDDAVLRFHRIPLDSGVATFIRRNRGNDVSGACGQLQKKEYVGSFGDRHPEQ